MNVEQLRHSLKVKWLTYYRDNRQWLNRLGVWTTCNGIRRPSSGFILAALSTLEPQLTQLLPLVVDLTNHPDRIVEALGLNVNPDEELKAASNRRLLDESKRMLPSTSQPTMVEIPPNPVTKTIATADEACEGVRASSDQPLRRNP